MASLSNLGCHSMHNLNITATYGILQYEKKKLLNNNIITSITYAIFVGDIANRNIQNSDTAGHEIRKQS